jgi:uncharacterized ferritin-like protein (DUF455 family)
VTSRELFDELLRVVLLSNPAEKCSATHALHQSVSKPGSLSLKLSSQTRSKEPHDIAIPTAEAGLPDQLELVPPRQLKKRSIQQQDGRNVLMHAIAHIEFNAVNLALDAAYRFRNQPDEYYSDWISVAADEARHFLLIQGYLHRHDCHYGDYPAHNGLWDMAVRTQDDVVARMALVPRVLEARGLDVTPQIIERLTRVGDEDAVEILRTIYNDEIEHVKTGSKWFYYQCEQNHLDPRQTFLEMIELHLHGELKGPFNFEARLLAGFNDQELDYLRHL